MRLIFGFLLFSFVTMVYAQDMPDNDSLEVISIDNVQNLTMIREFEFDDLPGNVVKLFNFNADLTRLYMSDLDTAIWYTELSSGVSTFLPIEACDCYPFAVVPHTTDPNLVLFNGIIINTDTNETIFRTGLVESYVFSQDGKYLFITNYIVDAVTGELIEPMFSNFDILDYPDRDFWGFDTNANGSVGAFIGRFDYDKRSYVVDVLTNSEQWVSMSIVPNVNEYGNPIRVSDNGNWIAYTTMVSSDNEDVLEVVVYSIDDPNKPMFSTIGVTDFEFDLDGTMLIGDGKVFDLKTQKSQKLLIPYFTVVEISYDGKLMATLHDESVKIWSVFAVD